MPTSLRNLAKKRFGDSISAYARGSEHLEEHAVSQCLPAIAALELDESYAAIVLTARMDSLLGDIIRFGAGRQGDADELLFSMDSPASTFSSKTRLAFFLGFLTPNMKKAIDDCRGIRNAYAHADSPDKGREDRKYEKKKRSLLGIDEDFTQEAVRYIRELAGDSAPESDDAIAVTAIMVLICDRLDSIVGMNRLHGSIYMPKVIPAYLGFSDAPIDTET